MSHACPHLIHMAGFLFVFFSSFFIVLFIDYYYIDELSLHPYHALLFDLLYIYDHFISSFDVYVVHSARRIGFDLLINQLQTITNGSQQISSTCTTCH
jgi:hypothetical protein